MSERIVTLNEDAIKGEIRELVRESIEETLNSLLEAVAEKLTQAARYERSAERQRYRSGHYDRELTTTSGDVTLHVPKLRYRQELCAMKHGNQGAMKPKSHYLHETSLTPTFDKELKRPFEGLNQPSSGRFMAY